MPAAARKPTADQLFNALGDPTRRAIVERLGRGPMSVSALAAPLGVTLTAVSQHLRVLEGSGLVRTRKTGRVRICAVDPEGLAVLEQWAALHRSMWTQRLDRLGDVLAEDESDG